MNGTMKDAIRSLYENRLEEATSYRAAVSLCETALNVADKSLHANVLRPLEPLTKSPDPDVAKLALVLRQNFLTIEKALTELSYKCADSLHTAGNLDNAIRK